MLTFILLVVLAGGVGLIVVSAAERDPATRPDRSRRGPEPEATPEDQPGGDLLSPGPTTEAPTSTLPVEAAATAPSGPTRRRHRGSVPASFTAVEGAFDAVALPSPGRRLVSLALVLTIVVVVAALIAGVTGLAAATIGRILDSAIG